jgi:putative FmdB family regulatory protein
VPIYEYRCRECGEDYEMLVSLVSKELPPCPKCGSEKVNKQMSLFGSARSDGSGGSSCGSSGFT